MTGPESVSGMNKAFCARQLIQLANARNKSCGLRAILFRSDLISWDPHVDLQGIAHAHFAPQNTNYRSVVRSGRSRRCCMSQGAQNADLLKRSYYRWSRGNAYQLITVHLKGKLLRGQIGWMQVKWRCTCHSPLMVHVRHAAAPVIAALHVELLVVRILPSIQAGCDFSARELASAADHAIHSPHGWCHGGKNQDEYGRAHRYLLHRYVDCLVYRKTKLVIHQPPPDICLPILAMQQAATLPSSFAGISANSLK